MNVSFVCPDCDHENRVEIGEEDGRFSCSGCDRVFQSSKRTPEEGHVDGCPVCGCKELYVRKDFSQRLGIMIVVIGVIASSIAWGFHMRYTTYGILFATALIDVVLYCTVGNMLQCYRCRAEIRGLAGLNEHEPFNLETHERYRQQAARLSEHQAATKARQS